MFKVKTFKRDTEYMDDMDPKINKWLAKNPHIDIVSHRTAMYDEYLITQILYIPVEEEPANNLDQIMA